MGQWPIYGVIGTEFAHLKMAKNTLSDQNYWLPLLRRDMVDTALTGGSSEGWVTTIFIN